MRSPDYVKIQDAYSSCVYYKVLQGTYVENGYVYETCMLKKIQNNKKLRPIDKTCTYCIERGECNFTTDIVKCPPNQWEN